MLAYVRDGVDADCIFSLEGIRSAESGGGRTVTNLERTCDHGSVVEAPG